MLSGCRTLDSKVRLGRLGTRNKCETLENHWRPFYSTFVTQTMTVTYRKINILSVPYLLKRYLDHSVRKTNSTVYILKPIAQQCLLQTVVSEDILETISPAPSRSGRITMRKTIVVFGEVWRVEPW